MPQKLPHHDRTVLRDALAGSPQFTTVRTRQIFVRDALGGYLSSEDILKALRFLDWEGAPAVVADDLLARLDGHELAPGIPALALITQAVEAMMSLAARHSMGWNNLDAPAETWRDHRPPSEFTRERIIGKNILKPLYYLRRGLIAADAVVRVDLAELGRGTAWDGGGGRIRTQSSDPRSRTSNTATRARA